MRILFLILCLAMAGPAEALSPSISQMTQARVGCTVTETPEVSCSDTIDNDCDGQTDGADSDCAAGPLISDNFSSDTSANYTGIVNGISTSGGTSGGTTNFQNNFAFHETSTGSNDHYVKAKVQVGTSTAAGGVILRCDGNGASSTGYRAALADNDRLYLHSFSGATHTLITHWAVSSDLIANQTYTVKVQVSGSTFTAWIDLNNDSDFGDVNESLGNLTSSTYASGPYVGISFNRSSGTDFRGDDLEGDAL
jgi:hypothetical protein